MPRKSFVIIEVGNIEVTLYWLNPRMDFNHVHVPEAQKVLNRCNFNSFGFFIALTSSFQICK